MVYKLDFRLFINNKKAIANITLLAIAFTCLNEYVCITKIYFFRLHLVFGKHQFYHTSCICF